MEGCVFCKIIKRQVPGFIINETAKTITFLSLENHPLVIPKIHIENIYTLDKENATAIIEEVTNIAKATKKALACDGVLVSQSNEEAAGQEVPHLHFHIYPRWNQSSLSLDHISREEKLGLVNKIKAALAT